MCQNFYPSSSVSTRSCHLTIGMWSESCSVTWLSLCARYRSNCYLHTWRGWSGDGGCWWVTPCRRYRRRPIACLLVQSHPRKGLRCCCACHPIYCAMLLIKWSIRDVKILIKKVPNNIVNHKNSNDDDTFLTYHYVRMYIYNNMCYVMLYIISLFDSK